MWCSDRRRLIAALAVLPALAACGFTPLYGENGPASRMIGRVAVAPLEGRFGFIMRQRLETRLGPAQAPVAELAVRPVLSSEGRAIRSDNTITRVNVAGRAAFTLTRLDGSGVVLSDEVRSFTAYSTTASPFATEVAGEDAVRRLAIALSDKIVLRLAADAGAWLP